MKKKVYNDYPITVSAVTDYSKDIPKIFLSKKRHTGMFVGVSLLDGSFLCENPSCLFSSLAVGEKLSLKRENEIDKLHASTLVVSRQDGAFVGYLPLAASIFPCKLLDLGVAVWCYFEAATLESDLLTVAVSIYCEDY